MLGESKLIVPPLMAVGVVVANVLDSLPGAARLILDLAALAVLFAGFLVLGRLRAQVVAADATTAAAEGAASAWKVERDALAIKIERLEGDTERLRDERNELLVQIAALEARPTLESLEEEVRKLQSLVQSAAAVTPAAPIVDDPDDRPAV